MDAARVILEARLRAGLTQEQLGRRTGMVITALSNWSGAWSVPASIRSSASYAGAATRST